MFQMGVKCSLSLGARGEDSDKTGSVRDGEGVKRGYTGDCGAGN